MNLEVLYKQFSGEDRKSVYLESLEKMYPDWSMYECKVNR